MKTLLILDDDLQRHDSLAARFPDHHAHRCVCLAEMSQALEQGRFDVATLDYSLGPDDWDQERDYLRTGLDAVAMLAQLPEERRPALVVCHSYNAGRGQEMANLATMHGMTAKAVPWRAS